MCACAHAAYVRTGLEVVVQPEAEEARLELAAEDEAVGQLLHARVEVDEVGVLAWGRRSAERRRDEGFARSGGVAKGRARTARAVDGGRRLQPEEEAGELAEEGCADTGRRDA